MSRIVRSGVRRSALAVLVVSLALTTALAGTASAKKEVVDKSGIVNVGLSIEDNGGVYFDPCSPKGAANPSARMWMDLIYDTMIHPTTDKKGSPGLASKWTTPDASTVELTLRDGVTFADGQPLTTDAVVKAWSCLLTGQRPNRGANVEAMTAVEKVDDKTVRIKLSKPIAADLVANDLQSAVHFGVPSPSVAAGTGDTTPVGAGPYQLKSYTTGKMDLSPNAKYYDKAAQKAGGFQIVNVATGAPSVSALQAGTVDLIWNFPPDSVATLENAPGVTVYSAPSEKQFQLSLCPTQGVFANQQARQAIQWAVDRAAIDAGALDGTGAANQTFLTPVSPYFNKTLAKTYKFDVKKAKALLKQAGVAEGTTVNMLVPSQPPYPAIGELAQSQLKAVGLNPVITQTASLASDAARIKPDLLVVSIEPSRGGLLYENESPLNPCGWKDPTVIAALNKTRDTTLTEAQKKAAWDDFQKIILDQSANIITNLQGALAAYTDTTKGLSIINPTYGPYLNTVYKVK